MPFEWAVTRLVSDDPAKALDRAGFAVIALGLRQCITDPEGHEMDVDTMEKLFLSLA